MQLCICFHWKLKPATHPESNIQNTNVVSTFALPSPSPLQKNRKHTDTLVHCTLEAIW